MFYDICPNCFNEIETPICRYCGYDQHNATKYSDVLMPEIILNARYLIGRVLGKGGFGVTYLAKDLARNKIVAVKECMPESYVTRSNDKIISNNGDTFAYQQCKNNFIGEINALHALNSNRFIVNISDDFSENNSEYFVMDFIDGVSLKVITNSQGGKTTFETAALVLFTVGSALMEVHKAGIIHRDISPENIMIDKSGNILLIDFGACKNYLEKGYYKNESIFLKIGFAPPEQYSLDGNQGPWTDVYALAAMFYTAVSGQPLMDSRDRISGDTMKPLYMLDCGINEEASAVISKAMEPDYNFRYGDVGSFLNDLSKCISFSGSVDEGTINVINDKRERENKLGDQGNTVDHEIPIVMVVNGKSAGRQFRIPDYEFLSIGRDRVSNNAIVLDDSTDISRKHCMIGFDMVHNRFIVVDKSSNGCYFSSGQRMLRNAESFVLPGDSFYICNGLIQIRLYLDNNKQR